MIWTSQSFGKYIPAENIVSCRTVGVPTGNAVIFLHGYEINGYANWQTSPANVEIMQALCDQGCLVISIDAGGQSTWANDSAMNAISSAVDYVESEYGFSRVSLLGQSMGGLNSLIWATQNSSRVNSVSTMISVVDLWSVHQIDAGFGSAIDAAYGGSYTEAAYGDTKNPMTMASNGLFNQSFPIQMWYGDSDELCLPSIAENFESILANVSAIKVTGGHSLSTIGEIDQKALADFIRANA